MPTASGSLAFLGAARFQGYWDATKNSATGSGLPGQKLNGVVNGLFSTGSSSNAGGFANATGLTASIGDYWQVTGSGTHNVDGSNSWALNDWCIYSGSVGTSGNWLKLAFEDTIASVVVGDIAGSTVFNLTGSSDKQILFITGATDAYVIQSGSDNFTFDYTNNLLSIAGNITASTNVSASAFYLDTNEYIYGDGTDINIAVGSSGDINIPANIGLTFGNDGEKIEGNGTSLSVAGGWVQLDSENDVLLDAGSGVVQLYDDGVLYGGLVNSSLDLILSSSRHDKDIKFIGSDAGAAVTALSLDMSAGGNAVFSNNVSASTNISASAFYGDGTNLTNVGAVSSITNGANDRLVTFSSADSLNGEANLTFSSANLFTVAGNITASSNISGSAFYGDIVTANITSTNGNDLILQSAAETYILSNSNIILDLDNDNNDTSSNFIVRNGTNTPIFIVTESTGLAYAAQLGVGTAGAEHTLSVTGTLGVSGDATVSGTLYANHLTASTISSSFYGDGAYLSNVPSVANGANDRLVTFSSADALNGEANLTFNSSNLLTVAGNITASTNVSASAFYGNGANLTSLPVTALNNQSVNRLVTIGSTITELDGEANLTFNGSTNLLTVGGNITGSQFYGGNIYNKNDTDTYIDFEGASNQINLFAGGFVHATFYGPSGGQKYILLNALKEDIDFKVHGDNTSDLLKVDAGLDKVGIATSSPEHVLSVTGTLGVSGDTTISGSSYLKNAIVAPGTSGGDGITVTHTDVDKHGIKVTTTNATTGAPLFIDHNDSTTVASTQKASFVIDFDKTGIQAQSTTASYAAQDITMIDAANNHAGGTVHMTGSSIIVSSSYNGGLATTNTGLRVETAGADSNYDALFLGGNVGIGTATPASKLSISTDEASNTVAHFFNDGDNINRYGISIQCGLDTSDGTSPTSNLWAALKDGNGTDKAYIAWVNGSSNAGFVAASDRRIKTDIAPTKVNALEVINNIPLSEFRMARKNEPVGDLVKVGFIAQDCESAWPEMVTEWENEDYDHKVKAVSPATLIPVLVKAVQELSAEVQALKAK
jgi:hypothetical protein